MPGLPEMLILAVIVVPVAVIAVAVVLLVKIGSAREDR
jgi:multisubunit Na+/H+ antiporter MnhC subunit